MSSGTSTDALQPWQFFVLAALGCATAVVFLARDRGIVAVVLLSVLMFAAALVGLAALRTLRPLVTHGDDRTVMIGGRTRAALEREKLLTLRAIKDLEFDKAMGKVSDEDFVEMATRLRARAAGLLRQLDAGQGYRAQIEQDLTRRLGEAPAPTAAAAAATRTCAQCSTVNDPDARFCKECGHKL
jgi:hypothetical protein